MSLRRVSMKVSMYFNIEVRNCLSLDNTMIILKEHETVN